MPPERIQPPRLRIPHVLLFLLPLFLAAGAARADIVYLTDGSTVMGTIHELSEQKLRIQTAFAGGLTIDTGKIRGFTADRKLTVALSTGDEIVGVPEFDPAGGTQRLRETALGEVVLEDAEIVGLWGVEEPAPAVEKARKADQQQIAELKAEHQKELKKVKEEATAFDDPWSLRLQAGLTGSTGNNERISFDGRAEAKREVPDERLNLFTAGHYAEQSGERSQNEIRGGGKLEVDISEKFFVYGKGELEFDEFENLDLRTKLSSGIGYFFWEEEDHMLKGRAGLGYQHESFMDGTTTDQALLELGYEYRYDWKEWLRFTHALTYYPTFEDPLGDYRLEAETAGEVPLSGDKAWKLRAGFRNEYDSQPQPGIEKLDTIYFLNLVYDVK